MAHHHRFRFVLAVVLVLVLGRSALAAAGDDAFLDDLERRAGRFFWEQADPVTGLIVDRAATAGLRPAAGGTSAAQAGTNRNTTASIASVGFGLSALCIADERGWVRPDQAYHRARQTLRTIADRLPQEHGFYYHFVDMRTGARVGKCEVSSIDTALLLGGVLAVRQYYHGTEIARLATKIYERVDWPWMLNGGATLSMGWTPEDGFLAGRWSDFSEHMILYLLGLGSPTHPLPPAAWLAWKRGPVVTYAGRTFLQCPPLFTHQYSQAWVDFRNQRDAYADYWRDSVLATLAQRQFCIDLQPQFPGYGSNVWGITSSDGPDGYQAWGGPPATVQPPIDGTVVPCAAGGSIPFAPTECLAALRFMRDHYGDRIWGRYGFADAFNPQTGWVGSDVIGIDVGITLLMAENQRSGLIWREFMRNPEIQQALRRAGFRRTTPTLPARDRQYLRRLAADTWRCLDHLVAPASGLPYDNNRQEEFTSVSNLGLYLTDIVAAREMKLISSRRAAAKLERALASIEQLKTRSTNSGQAWHGFQQCWNSVATLAPGTNDTWVSLVDSGNFAAGLLTVGQAFPQFRARCQRLVAAMDWGAFYDPKCRLLRGGYNTATGQFHPDWHVVFLGADSRLASFFAVATGQAPVASWEALSRELEERQHVRYLIPGWQGGGLFMQYINGLWLDERHTLMGQSAQNFAYAQMLHAAAIAGQQPNPPPAPPEEGSPDSSFILHPSSFAAQSPPWGWSASDSPRDGYLGWGKLRDNIVTPHACALAISDFPPEVVANLRALEKLGARHGRWGFADAIDLATGQVTTSFLMLDQSMLFLSLANYLQDDVVRKYFQADPLVQRGRELIADYRQPAFGADTSLLVLNARPRDQRLAPQKIFQVPRFAGWATATWQPLTVADSLESSGAADQPKSHAEFAFAWDEQALHFAIRVRQAAVVNDREPAKLFEQDCVELFIDPQNDGLRWGDRADFQFGFAVPDKTWEWFGQRALRQAATRRTADGYEVEAAIPWALLGISPVRGKVLQVSPALHTVDAHGGPPMKWNWSWQPNGGRVRLGRLVLE